MSNQMPRTDGLPVEIAPSIGQMFTPDEVAQGSDYQLMNFPRSTSLATRLERPWVDGCRTSTNSIIEAMAIRALDGKDGKALAKLCGSKKLHRQFELIDKLPDEDFSQFLDMLEAGVPDGFKHMLRTQGGQK